MQDKCTQHKPTLGRMVVLESEDPVEILRFSILTGEMEGGTRVAEEKRRLRCCAPLSQLC